MRHKLQSPTAISPIAPPEDISKLHTQRPPHWIRAAWLAAVLAAVWALPAAGGALAPAVRAVAEALAPGAPPSGPGVTLGLRN